MYNKIRNYTHKGGKFLGEGSYGCVVSPSLPCKITRKRDTDTDTNIDTNTYTHTHTDTHIPKSVSKIILVPDEEVEVEISISNKLRRIDPQQKHYITFNNACPIKYLPSDRSDTVSVRCSDESQEKCIKLERKQLDKKYCKIDLRTNPINLIMSYGGYNLINIIDNIENMKKTEHIIMYNISSRNLRGHTKKKTQGPSSTTTRTTRTTRTTSSTTSSIRSKNKRKNKHKNKSKIINKYSKYEELLIIKNKLFKQFNECFKNLLIGLFKMHDNRIVNRDIKGENIMVNYNKHTNTVEMRYIDFGLSSELTIEYCSKRSNINLHGTEGFISPELIISYFLNDKTVSYDNNSLHKVQKLVSKYTKEMLMSLKERRIYTEMHTTVKTLFNKINKEFTSNNIKTQYFGTPIDKFNGYLQKGDVYALGIAIYEFLESYRVESNILDKSLNKYKKKHSYRKSSISSDSRDSIIRSINVKQNTKLYNLLKHMIEPNPETRYNVIMCLKHPYFK